MAPKPVFCEGSPSWNPDAYLADTELHTRASALLAKNDLRSAITTSFSLRKTDSYVYHAIVATNLAQVQQVVSLGDGHGLHNWYFDEPPPPTSEEPIDTNGEISTPKASPQPLPPPPKPDIEAYLSIFSPSNSAPTALRNFTSNAKKGSLRQQIGQHLTSKRYVHPSYTTTLNKLPRQKSKPAPHHPYLTYLSWAISNLEYAGPCRASELNPYRTPNAQLTLPILMHHFGCVCPSHEALEILRLLADGREILDVGSGNGYWTRMLREYYAFHKVKATAEVPLVTPVDSAQSAWRTSWVGDTVIADGAAYLREARKGARDAVLLLVYPIVGGGIAGGSEGGFTRGCLDAYEGDTVAVVGTQNGNGYTGFRSMTMDQYMERERGEWVKVVQVPLPSFPGKDEALYVFQRGERAPKMGADGEGEGKGKGS
ncbi:hypothetical protein GGR57DRAFT_252600 [Xylariaceae sp. FL1272]|nr:hypothetical protein GGR57DRAFT_252600 [Xylariaceae sp. FL1272]